MLKGFKILKVEKGSPAWHKKIKCGDSLLMLDGHFVKDIIDYRYFLAGEYLSLLIKTKEGILRRYKIKKQYDEDLGLVFDYLTLEPPIRCRNKCIFCFVDQLPPGLRQTLYFKDDDYRLSFLYGNYITLTALKKDDIKRIVRERLTPLYISIHATDPAVRSFMLGNQKAGELLDKLKYLAANDIEFHGQIVLCPGINDQEVLKKTIADLALFYPSLRSLAVVPVGLTEHRQNLYPLQPVTAADAKEALSIIQEKQIRFLQNFGTRLIFPSDELFLKAGQPIPPDIYYEDYSQLENGVGLWRLMAEDIKKWGSSIKQAVNKQKIKKVSLYLVTGVAASPLLQRVVDLLNELPLVSARLIVAHNFFFGENITVAGLVTGHDILKAIKTILDRGDFLVVPRIMLKENSNTFLDGMTLDRLSQEVSMDAIAIDSLYDINPLVFYQEGDR